MDWHTVVRVADHVYQIAEPFGEVEPRVGVATVNMYLVIGEERAALIDSGMGIGDLAGTVRALTSLPCVVLNTHSHWDHVGANHAFADAAIHHAEAALLARSENVTWMREAMQAPRARAALPPGFDPATYHIEPPPPTRILKDGDTVGLGGCVLRVLHTPGHSPGHVAFLEEASGLLFTGDTAYRGPLFACFNGSNASDFAQSVQRLATLSGVRLLCPGHNDLISSAGWLGTLADGVEQAMSGQAPSHMRGGLIPAREYPFADFSLCLPTDFAAPGQC